MDLSKKAYDIASQQMIRKALNENIETVFDRQRAMEPQCGFGEMGICCRNCLQGPCRINPYGKPDRGICGADADTIVARNLLRMVCGGASTHVDHAFETLELLEKTADGKLPYDIKGEDKLRAVASSLGIAAAGKDKYTLAKEVAKAILSDFAPGKETMDYLRASVPEERVNVWCNLGILPKTPDGEIRRVMHQTTMGVDADAVNLLLSTAKMGVVDGYAGLKLGSDLQDIVFGTPTPVKTEANLGVLEKDKVNIVVHGHIPFLSEKIVEWAEKLENEARAAGAKGIKLSGLCCTGHEVLMRKGVAAAGNYLSQELAVITGAVDLMVVDVQCIMPALPSVASCYHTKIVTTHELGRIPGAEHVSFREDHADEDAAKIVRLAIETYQLRDHSRVEIPKEKAEMWGGFSAEAVVDALSKVDAARPLRPLVDAVAQGKIRGIVGMVGCNNSKFPQDYVHVELCKELLRNNVLVVVTGCAAHAMGKAGLMCPQGAETYAGAELLSVLRAVGEAAGLNAPLPPVLHMGSCVDNGRIGDLLAALAAEMQVDIKDLPAAASAPELAHEKAVSIGTWAVDMGLFTHIGLAPQVLGSPYVTKILTEDLERLGLGRFYVESDPLRAAKGILDHIDKKRAGLGL